MVASSIYDQVAMACRSDSSSTDGQNNISFLRIMRLAKMMKLLRMIRIMRMFRQLRLIVHSIMGSMRAILWSIVLIVTIAYMVGICFLQACTGYLQQMNEISPALMDEIMDNWGSLGTSMISLYVSCTGGENWAVIARPLEDVGFPYYALFMLYIAFFQFVILNTLTSLFVESTMENADRDQQFIIQLELEKKHVYAARLQAFYDEIDDEGTGEISYQKFCEHVTSPTIQAFAESLEIDVTDAKQFFCILSDQGRRCVDIETFVVGCIKLKGMAKSMDMMDLLYSHRKAVARAVEFENNCKAKLDRIENLITARFEQPAGLQPWATI